jgi:hypothetical protein
MSAQALTLWGSKVIGKPKQVLFNLSSTVAVSSRGLRRAIQCAAAMSGNRRVSANCEPMVYNEKKSPERLQRASLPSLPSLQNTGDWDSVRLCPVTTCSIYRQPQRTWIGLIHSSQSWYAIIRTGGSAGICHREVIVTKFKRFVKRGWCYTDAEFG